MRRGVYPGSFNPPTRAHLSLAAAAREQRSLDRVDLALSHVPLGKAAVTAPTFEERLEVIRASIASFDWLDVVITKDQLIADIACGYDCVIMGADKWFQIHEVGFYSSVTARDAAVASLPNPAVAPRAGVGVPAEVAVEVDEWLAEISSTGARSGQRDWMTPEAAASELWA